MGDVMTAAANRTRTLARLYWLVTLATVAAAVVLVLKYTPVELSMGPIQKLFYLHLPAAIFTFVACLTCFVASVGYLTQRKTLWDDLAAASARVAVQLCTVVLVTGMVWGHSAWGQWWTWSPRLTFSLVLWLLYVVYLIIRVSVESGHRRAVIGSVYAIIAFLDVPLVWLSTKLMTDIHPTSVTLAPQMKLTLALCFVPTALVATGLVVRGFTRDRARRAAAEQRRSAEVAPAGGFEWAPGGGNTS
jgi:heme exporter protein C